MKKLLLYILAELTDYPEKIVIEEEKTATNMKILNLSVDPEDMGKIIGRQGKIIKAIRNVLRIKAIKEGFNFSLNLKDNS